MYFVKIGSLIINCDTIESISIEEGINSDNICEHEYKIAVKTCSTIHYPKTFKTKYEAEEEIDWTYTKLKYYKRTFRRVNKNEVCCRRWYRV